MPSPIGEQGDETFIVGEGAQGIPQGQVGVAVWKGSRGDVDGQFRDGAYGSRLDSSRISLPSRIIRPEALGEEYQILVFRFEESRDGLSARSLGCSCWSRQSFVGNTARDVFLSFWSDLRSVL